MQPEIGKIYFVAEKILESFFQHHARLLADIALQQTPTGLQELYQTHPELAKLYEGKTLEEKKDAAKELAWALAIAEAIVRMH